MRFSRRVENMIADLRGVPKDRSRSRIHKTQTIEDLINKAVAKFNIGEEDVQAVIMANWKTIIGPNFAHRCCPITITRNNSLLVQVSNPTLKNELSFQILDIMKRLRAVPGCEKISSVSFRTR